MPHWANHTEQDHGSGSSWRCIMELLVMQYQTKSAHKPDRSTQSLIPNSWFFYKSSLITSGIGKHRESMHIQQGAITRWMDAEKKNHLTGSDSRLVPWSLLRSTSVIVRSCLSHTSTTFCTLSQRCADQTRQQAISFALQGSVCGENETHEIQPAIRCRVLQSKEALGWHPDLGCLGQQSLKRYAGWWIILK